MSFLSLIGLSSIDKLTGNALDKLGNAIKDGDVKGIVKQLTGILDGVEDRLEDISELFEDAVDKGKRDVQRQVAKVKKRMMREVREDLESLEGQFTDKMAKAMESRLKELVAAEVDRRMDSVGAGYSPPDTES